MSNIPVLIVGAGPTGLMMAYELARHGIAFRIIDKKPEPTKNSNAAALQTRTLEIFKQLGIADEFLRVGQPCKSLNFYDRGKQFASAKFNDLNSIYHCILALPQAATEKILNKKLADLHHNVERSRDLIEVKMNLNDIEAVVKHDDGVLETIRCQWLLGCDGAHSTVRDKCGFEFPGDDIPDQFIVADGVLDSFLHADEVHIFTANGYMLGVFPLGEGKYRLGGNTNLSYPRKVYTDNDVRELVAERSYGQFNARNISWISPFWIHSKMSAEMRRANVFLLGDAAHIHSPLGGQGMNTGLQDAHNLAWKLALVVQGRAGAGLLDSYQEERLPVIKDVVDTTDRFTRILLIKNPIIGFLRKYTIKFMLSLPAVNRYITRRLTQLSIRYHESKIISYQSKLSATEPKTGERAPDVKFNFDNNFYNYLNDNQHHLICFTGERDIFKTVDQCRIIIASLLGPYKDLLKLHLVTPHLIDEPIDQIFDEANVMHQTYQIKEPAIILIRPDGYIALKTDNLEAQPLKEFLSTYFN